jgi:glycosyltransferase involved in cell wall biosynthesis
LAQQAPLVTFGIPVRNEAVSIVRCLDSILAQSFEDFEVIVSDNASTDPTPDVVLEYAERDPRIRLFAFEENQGVIENFNHVVRLARGEYFRWMGADDWIEPTYVAECVAALERTPTAIVATTYFDLERRHDEYEYTEYQGELLESDDPVRRLERMLHLIHEGPSVYEPIYSMMRRRVLLNTGLLRVHRKNDWLLAAQLSLAGSFVHVPQRLFHRWWPVDQERRSNLAPKLHPIRYRELRVSVSHLYRGLLVVIDQAALSTADRRRCRRHAAIFCARMLPTVVVKRINQFRRERLGLTRERFRRA